MPNMMDLPLRDIHLPDPVSWWPLAFGWWLVFSGVVLLILAAVMVLKRLLKPTLKKEASKALDHIERTFLENDDASQCLSELSTFLRRAMLSRKDSSKVAGVTGEAWLDLLDAPLGEHAFSQGIGRILLTGPYVPQVDKEEVVDLIQLCRQWVKTL